MQIVSYELSLPMVCTVLCVTLVCMFTQKPRTSSATGGPAQYDINLVGKAMALSNKLQTKYAHVFVSRQKVAQSGRWPVIRPQ